MDLTLLTGKNVELLATQDVRGIYNKDINLYEMQFKLKEGITIPIEEDEVIGYVDLYYNGYFHGSIEVSPSEKIR